VITESGSSVAASAGTGGVAARFEAFQRLLKLRGDEWKLFSLYEVLSRQLVSLTMRCSK